MTICKKAGLQYDCWACAAGRLEYCCVRTFTVLEGAYITGSRARFRKYLYNYAVYYKDVKDIDGNPYMNYVVAAVRLYYSEYIDDLNKMLILL